MGSGSKKRHRQQVISRPDVTGMPPLASGLIAASHESYYSGPIPPPQFLREYNEIVPNAAERLLTMAEKQTDHRIALEKKALNSDILRSYCGLGAGFILTMTATVFGGLSLMQGRDVWSFLLGVSGMATLVYVFIKGKKMTTREREDKSKAMKRS